jgi:hypothetical protein
MWRKPLIAFPKKEGENRLNNRLILRIFSWEGSDILSCQLFRFRLLAEPMEGWIFRNQVRGLALNYVT